MANDRETERLDKYVCSVTSFTRSVLGKEIRKRGASLNGKQVKDPSVKVTDGDVIGIAGMEITVSLKPVYLMMKNSFIAPSINVETPDPSVEGVPLVTKTEERELEHVMSNSFGFGGTNSALVLRKL